jgi:CubicO group peptidase (beta-lactamase class C family)
MRHLARYSLALFLLAVSLPAYADKIDDFIREQMQKHNIRGLSLAIIQDGKIVKAQGYGVTDEATNTQVTPSTLFQAGSISKSVSAMAALRLVEQGKLALDENVNAKLTTWKVPDNQFTRQKPVTLRGILSHTAGLTAHGFPGYPSDGPIPTLVQVLDGVPPANTAAIRVETIPGTRWNYSGGGYTVVQQLMLDVTGKPFPEFMRQSVLVPLGMASSTYEQPLPAAKARLTATGYDLKGQAVRGRWNIYPEMAAAGLWTTPTDLARFAIGVQQSYAGKSNPVISQSMTRQMLTIQKADDGLGVFLIGSGRALRFEHSGRDKGFDALLQATAETGQGAVIMINANDNFGTVPLIMKAIAKEYGWP